MKYIEEKIFFSEYIPFRKKRIILMQSTEVISDGNAISFNLLNTMSSYILISQNTFKIRISN